MRNIRFMIGLGILAVILGSSGTLWGQESESQLQVAQVAPAAPQDSVKISLDFKDAEIQTVLQAIARKAKVNIVTGKSVTGLVTIHLEDVTWEQALDAIVKTYGYAYDKDENVILVTTLEELKTRRDALKQLVEIEPVTTKVIQLKYLDAGDVKAFLEPQLTSQGRLSVLAITGQKGWTFGTVQAGESGTEEERKRRAREKARSKAIVITDTPTTIDRLEKILVRIDIMPKQILIESKVMEVHRDLLRDLGLEVGTGSGSTTTSSSEGFVSSSGSRTFSAQSLDKRTGQADTTKFGGSVLNQVVTPASFVPVAQGLTAANTGLSLILRKLRGTQVEVLVRALEEDIRTNTLSAPHVLTLSGQEARILIGRKFPIINTQVTGTGSTATTTSSLSYYQDIGIELFVVPQISGERHVDMIIHPVVSSQNGSVTTNNATYPVLDVREAETQIVTEDGETVVIGGLLKDVKTKSRVGLPFLGKLPFVGPLFARSTTDMEKIDLLIFITARIVEPGGPSTEETARLQQQYEEFLQERFKKRGAHRSRSGPIPSESPESQMPGESNRGFLYWKR